MASCVVVRFIDESDFVNKGIGFILRDCSGWELDSTISLELTDLLDDIITTSKYNFSEIHISRPTP